jgi:hypothetical protein
MLPPQGYFLAEYRNSHGVTKTHNEVSHRHNIYSDELIRQTSHWIGPGSTGR